MRTPGQALRDTAKYKNGRLLETWSKHADRSGFTACVRVVEHLARTGYCTCDDGGDDFKCDWCEAKAALAKVRGDA